MSLTLWHRQFRNPIFLVLWTSYPGVQLVTFAAVSLCGGATRCLNINVQIGPRWKRYWEDSTITEKGGGKCCGKALKAAGGVEVVDVIRIRAPKKWVAGARIQAQSAGGRYMGLDRALIST